MLKPGQVIALCVLALLCFGVVMVTSALMEVNQHVTVQSILLSRWTIYMAIAMLALTCTGLLPWTRWIPAHWLTHTPEPAPPADQPTAWRHRLGGFACWPLWTCALLLVACMAMVYLPGVGRTVNGSHRWINLQLPVVGDLSAQPSEIAKWALIPLMAWYGVRQGPKLRHFFTGLAPALGAVAIVAGFIVIEDLGTAVLVGAVAATVLVAAGARVWQFLLMLPLAALAFAGAVVANPYRLTRLETFLNPYKDPEGSGYHMIQSMLAVHNGELTGRGLGHGMQKFGYLPEDQTDFLFAIICEETGLAGAALVALLYAGILWAGLSIIRKQPAPFLKLIAVGVLSTLGLQALINLAVVTGLGPTKGIALPLLSAGGTGWILTSACLGTLIAIDRHARAHAHAHAQSPTSKEPAPSPARAPESTSSSLAPAAA